MSIKIVSLHFLQGTLPGQVHLVLSDGPTEEESKVWISARFSLEPPADGRLAVLPLEALGQLQNLIAEGRTHHEKPPSARKP